MIEYAHPKHSPAQYPLVLRILLASSIELGWMLLGGLAVAVPAVIVGKAIVPPAAYIAVFGTVIVLVVTARCVRAARRRQALTLLGYLEQATRLNLPLSPMLQAVQRAETPAVARRLARLRGSLDDGAPVGDALAAAAPATPPRMVAMIDVAERNGHLPQALHRAYRDELTSAQVDPARGAFAWAYLLVVVISIAGTLGLVGIFVMPKFEQIFKDFRIQLPDITITTLRMTRNLAIPVTLLALALLLWICGRAVRNLLRSRPSSNPLAELLQRLAWLTPILGRLARDRGLADVFTTIADALEAGRPATDALADAQLPHVNIELRERVTRWGERVTDGESLADAARRAMMPRLVSGLINTAQPADLVNVFRFLARYYDGRFSRLALLVRDAMVPALAIGFGILVTFVVLSVVLPMIKLIDAVNPVEFRP